MHPENERMEWSEFVGPLVSFQRLSSELCGPVTFFDAPCRCSGVNTPRMAVAHPTKANRSTVSTTEAGAQIFTYIRCIPSVLAVCTGALSFLVLLGVIGMMAGHSSGLSVFSYVLLKPLSKQITDECCFRTVVHRENASSAGITIFILLTLGYLAYIVAWGMFQVDDCRLPARMLIFLN